MTKRELSGSHDREYQNFSINEGRHQHPSDERFNNAFLSHKFGLLQRGSKKFWDWYSGRGCRKDTSCKCMYITQGQKMEERKGRTEEGGEKMYEQKEKNGMNRRWSRGRIE